MTVFGHFNKLTPLLHRAYFTSQEARKHGVHPALLSYYIKIGKLKRIQRGLYQSATSLATKSLQWEDLLQAICSIPKGVICLTTALIIYDYSEDIARRHWIAISHDTTARSSKHTKIIRMRNISLGKSKILLDGVQIPIFDRERTLIDSFRLLGQETAIKALKVALSKKGDEKLNLRKLQQYAKKLRVNITPYLTTLST